MDLDDLIQVLVAAAVVMAGLFGGRKKKPPPPRRPAPPRREPVRPPPVRATPQPHQPSGRDHLLADLQRQLESARGEVTTDMPEAFSLEETSVEAQSLETLEPAGEASHERFHRDFIKPLGELRSLEPRAALPPGGMRSAVVWAEILGPPRGLQP